MASLLGLAQAEGHTCQEAAHPQAETTRPRTIDKGRLTGEGQAYFPVMSSQELASLTVPASASPAELRRVFSEYGVCLVTGVLSPQECALIEELWQEDLLQTLDQEHALMEREQLNSLGLSAWCAEWDKTLGSKGCASQRALPHGGFAWGARLHPQVRQTFADLFDTTSDELCVGLDNTFWSAADDPATSSNREWLHVDQNHCTGMTWPCAQGILYV